MAEQTPQPAAGPNPTVHEYPEELKKRALGFFEKGAEVAYALNYDYAIELYLDGLSFWPEAMEKGHKPLREIALRRQAAGGKKSGFGDGSKYKKGSSKNPKDALLKAEYLLSKEPFNQAHMKDMLKAAVEGEFQEVGRWIADVLFDNNMKAEKPSLQTYIFLRDNYSKLDMWPRALQTCQLALQMKPGDAELQDYVRDLSARATLQQGQYDQDKDFRESIKNRDEQAKLQTQEQVVRSESTMEQAIIDARKDYLAEPTLPGKIDKLVAALSATEKEGYENEAVEILEKAAQATGQFRYRQRAGELKIRQLNRKQRRLAEKQRKDPSNAVLIEQMADMAEASMKMELEHYRLCMENYPTDTRYKYEYGQRLMKSKQYDQAIPLFQEARNDPRYRVNSLNCIGRCFFYKKWFSDAVETFSQALEALEDKEGAAAKDLLYYLGRAYEADGNTAEALNHYRRVAQIDFNYKDARSRVDALRKQQNGG